MSKEQGILEERTFELDLKQIALPEGLSIVKPANLVSVCLDNYLEGTYAVIIKGALIKQNQAYTTTDKERAKKAYDLVVKNFEMREYEYSLVNTEMFGIWPSITPMLWSDKF